eukprot:TRINITY_DN48675_c0_g1_i1.p1 TRINITY_DN48675_c0_g1~~TRINITY_DN48675_c0_g1_i1.p1  ORF type:complete len:310 (-),score=10.40 TRINITY_DN48675_c0_g1_i1:246-1175(-)
MDKRILLLPAVLLTLILVWRPIPQQRQEIISLLPVTCNCTCPPQKDHTNHSCPECPEQQPCAPCEQKICPPIPEQRLQAPTTSKPTVLDGYQSQCGQEIWALSVLGWKKNGFFVDMAANEPQWISNTYLLEQTMGWHGILIEPNPTLVARLKAQRSKRSKVLPYGVSSTAGAVKLSHAAGKPYEAVIDSTCHHNTCFDVRTKTFASMLEEGGAPSVIDFLSLDVEGYEWEAMKDFPWNKYTFLTLVIERPNHQLKTALAEHGYVHNAKPTSCHGDHWYVHKSVEFTTPIVVPWRISESTTDYKKRMGAK